MSQYGAYGLAQQGWGAARILRHYYTGIRLARRTPPAPAFRVGLLQHRGTVTLTATRGSFTLRLAGGRRIETVPEGGTRTVQISGGRYRIRTPTGTLVGDRAWGGPKRPLRVRRASGGVVRVAEWGRSVGRGWLELPIAGTAGAHLVAVVPAELYLFGLGEVPSSWPEAVLRAQAIAARSYAFRRVAAGRTGCACDILGDPRDQAYIGWDKEAGTDGSRWVGAVRETAGRVAISGGEIISTLYSSSSGGYTEDAENIWGGSPVPYLKGVCDPGDYVPVNPNRTWSVQLSGAEVAARVRAAFGWDVAEVTALEAGARGVSGRVVRMTVRGRRSGGSAFSATTSGWSLRGALGLRDTRFWVNADRNVTGAIRHAYDEMGCAPGLAGSARRSIEGGAWQGFQRGRMYHDQGVGVVVWLRGPAWRKYRDVGAHGSFLGLPRSLDPVGRRAAFAGGEIYWKASLGAFEVHGAVLSRYRAAGGPGGDLGYPTSDVVMLADGRLRSTFEGGAITCVPDGACSVTTP